MSALHITSGEDGEGYPLVVTDLNPDRELGFAVGNTGGASVLDVDQARVLRDYLTGWIVAQENKP